MANSAMFTKHHGAAKAAHSAGNIRLARHHVGKMLHALSDRASGQPPMQELSAMEQAEAPMPQPNGLRAKLAAMKSPLANPSGGM